MFEIEDWIRPFISPDLVKWGFNNSKGCFFIDFGYNLPFHTASEIVKLDFTDFGGVKVTGYFSFLSQRLERLELQSLDGDEDYFNGSNVDSIILSIKHFMLTYIDKHKDCHHLANLHISFIMNAVKNTKVLERSIQ